MSDEELVGSFIEPAKARGIDFLILGVDFVRRSVGMVEEALSNLEQVLCSHANYRADQEAFADAVRLDIESLNQEE